MVSLRLALALLLLSTTLAARTLSRYALLLSDPPAARSETAALVLRDKQQVLQTELRRRKFHVTGATQMLVNAVYVVADPARLAELRSLPGVRRVAFLPPVRLSLDHAEQIVNTQGGWNLLGGMSNAGTGIKIAIIDTGIDQTHPGFQDSTLTPPAGFPICQDADCAFTNNKVIVARSYIRQQAAGSPDDPAADSRPDDFSPRDHQGHGTAVAMVAAGVTNTGPGDTITGFAPRAFLGNYRVFGSPGLNDSASEDAVIAALEDALNDGMDIANLSLGGPALTGALDSGAVCGEADGVPCDTLSQAVENATRMGLLVVTAGGNEGATGFFYPALGTVNSPAIAPSAIAVAATTNSHVWQTLPTGFIALDIPIFNAVANFSSRGPALGTAAIKPEMAAVGTNLFLPAQNYDAFGDLYSPLRYMIASGTSFSAPMVSGAAALVKQNHPAWQPWQIKSALVNSATQDVTDSLAIAAVTAVGAGKLNVGNAVAANVSVSPQTASFGVIQSLPATQTFQLRNSGSRAVALQISVAPRTTDTQAAVSVDQSNLTIAPGESAAFTVTLSGNMPNPGSYQGFILIQGDTSPLSIPYLYLVSDGNPVNLVPLLGNDGAIGLAGQEVPDGMLALEVIDQFGLPLPNVPVAFGIQQGGGQIASADSATNQYGIATAQAIMGPAATANVFTATAANVRVLFIDTGVLQPLISDNGVVNSASFQPGPGIAPGSYVSIFGFNLAFGAVGETTVHLPVSLQSVSVSFDVPEANLSLPGHLIYVSPGQVNVQVPWELRGQGSVKIKVSISNASGLVATVPVADYSPGVYSYSSGGQSFAAAQDSASAPITTDHPAVRGQTVTLYGSGFGPVNNQPASGDPATDATSTTLATPNIMIGGLPAPVTFSGLAPGYAGLYQINVTVPPTVQSGLQTLSVAVNGAAANTVLLPVQ